MYVVYLFLQLPLLVSKFEAFLEVTFNNNKKKWETIYMYTYIPYENSRSFFLICILNKLLFHCYMGI